MSKGLQIIVDPEVTASGICGWKVVDLVGMGYEALPINYVAAPGAVVVESLGGKEKYLQVIQDDVGRACVTCADGNVIITRRELCKVGSSITVEELDSILSIMSEAGNRLHELNAAVRTKRAAWCEQGRQTHHF